MLRTRPVSKDAPRARSAWNLVGRWRSWGPWLAAAVAVAAGARAGGRGADRGRVRPPLARLLPVGGVVWGTVAVSLGSTAGAAAAFQLARRFLRERLEQRIAADPCLRAIDRAVGSEGFRLVLLLRLAPVPHFALLNYLLGTTRVRFRDFVLATWLGALPATAFLVAIGAGMRRLLTGSPLTIAGALAGAAALLLLGRSAKRRLDEAVAAQGKGSSRREGNET